ncbi:penicillin-binding protein activator [Bradyrhizobium sp. U87765 SZCCT0131]|uniref:penicillin-binding protein activator n=2 Tax=Bradyrhizobium TaxID=374 RepID=UPI001BA84617|nr:penicillin-binding protein activator [Bradyrhizobium sp. U87765 SZCCT0131]MBR1259462.1 penicillin-binding protein activator [Bradyrhizobium sp. U87765 SZCCT0134]MBR1305603.1 penicillin-binding protein activator [Bradyrhizobium sp. U87765 SZCCT0110]MBR1321970.1 penicillin-binding protein activator [Bradyrhizobium sp. U87765 SZCCT0109]MBR1350752.1 penicillin-binding protein activator [Bradyrhizobium sp. U87765 SZCCT0048]
MVAPNDPLMPRRGPTRRSALGLFVAAPFVAGCSNVATNLPWQDQAPPPAGPSGPPQQPTSVGTGNVKVGLILPMSGAGNAGVVGQSMRNAAEMALAEFQNPNVQLLVKDDGGSPQTAGQAAQQALDEGAEILLGPLFAQSVPPAAQPARARNVPMIAFSTDSSVAGHGVFLLSFLPESDVNRIVDYAAGTGKRSFAAMLPENAYGNVVEVAFKQAVARRGGRVVAFEKYGADRTAAARNVAQALGTADALFLADDGDALVATADALTVAGANLKRVQLIGTGLWDSPRVFNSAVLQGGLYAAPDPSGFRAFSGRYRSKYGQDPVRTATLAYDAVALVAALARTQGNQRFSQDVLLNTSGFAGIDGLFRFRSDGSNERGLAVMRVASGGGQAVAGSPKSFAT